MRSIRKYRYRRRPRLRSALRLPKLSKRLPVLLLILAMLIFSYSLARGQLRQVSGEVAATEAYDLVTRHITAAVNRRIQEGGFDYNDFVSVTRDSEGAVTAITTNTARINQLSATLLGDIVGSTEENMTEIRIPVGSLMGSQLFQGRGPSVPVKVYMLTNSSAAFRNELTSAGINQTKHEIILDISVSVRIMIPWQTIRTTVNSEVLLAETIIVGKVPDTFVTVN